MPNLVKINSKTYKALETLYTLSEKNSELVHKILKKNKVIKKEVWVSFFNMFAFKEWGETLEKETSLKATFRDFSSTYTPYGRYIFEDMDDSKIEVDWDALISQ